MSHFRPGDRIKIITPERKPRTGQVVTDTDRARPPNHDGHVHTYRNYWDDQSEKLSDLSLRFLFLRPRKQRTQITDDLERNIGLKDPTGAMVTVNDWAKAKGLVLSISQATEVGMRAAKLYEAKYGMPPSQTPSWKGPRFSTYQRDMRRPGKDTTASILPRHLLNTVGEYPKPTIEKAWRMTQAIEKAR